MARDQWSEVEARGVLQAWRKSGLSVERFARQRGLVPQRLHWWKRKIEKAEQGLVVAAPAMLPVQVTSERAPRGEPVTLLLRTGHMVKVSRGFDEHAFTRVVALLEGS